MFVNSLLVVYLISKGFIPHLADLSISSDPFQASNVSLNL